MVPDGFHAPFFGPEISRLPHLPQDLVVLVMVTGVHLAEKLLQATSHEEPPDPPVYPWRVPI